MPTFISLAAHYGGPISTRRIWTGALSTTFCKCRRPGKTCSIRSPSANIRRRIIWALSCRCCNRAMIRFMSHGGNISTST